MLKPIITIIIITIPHDVDIPLRKLPLPTLEIYNILMYIFCLGI